MITMDNEDDNKLCFTFEFSKQKFSELELNKAVYSPKYSVADVTLKILIKKRVAKKSEKHVLLFFLCVEGETKLWCCYARVRLTILSQKDSVENKSRRFERLFSSSECNRGYHEFIDWDDVTNPELGYINNDIVKFQVHIVADPPQNVDPNYKKVEPMKSEDWLSVFEDQINEQIVCRISEEFKKVISLLEEVKKTEKSSKSEIITKINSDVRRTSEELNKTVVDSLDAVRCTSKELNKTFVDSLDAVKSAVDELKNQLLKKDEDSDEGKVHDVNDEEENKNHESEVKDLRESEAVNKDFVVKMLNDFKNDIMREVASHQRPENRFSSGTSPWYGYSEPFFSHPNYGYGHKSGTDHHLCGTSNFPCETAPHNRMGCTAQKTCLKNELGCCIPSSSFTRQFHEIEKYLEKNDGNESDSTDTSRYVFVQPASVSHPSILSEEDALSKNMDLNKPLKKGLIVIGKDGDGKQETHKVTCLKQLFDLKKKLVEYEVFESEKIEMP